MGGIPHAPALDRCDYDPIELFVGTYLVCVVNTLSCGPFNITLLGYGVLVR